MEVVSGRGWEMIPLPALGKVAGSFLNNHLIFPSQASFPAVPRNGVLLRMVGLQR